MDIYDTLTFLLQKIEQLEKDVVQSGMISIIKGNISIPNGWVLCDGANGTPDLSDKFVLGSGSTYNDEETGGLESVNVNIVAASTTSSDVELPQHAHTITSAKIGGTLGCYGYVLSYANTGNDFCWSSAQHENKPTSLEGSGTGSHDHAVSFNQNLNNMPPYYVLRYIMKE